MNTVLQIVPALGVIVALLYCTITIRNTEKQRRKDFIFQRNLCRTHKYYQIVNEILSMWDFEKWYELEKKYNLEQKAKLTFCWPIK